MLKLCAQYLRRSKNSVKGIVAVCCMVGLMACSTSDDKADLINESEAKHQNQQEKHPEGPSASKPIVGSATPKTTKPVSEMMPVPESEKNSEIKIVPNRDPYQEKPEQDDSNERDSNAENDNEDEN